MTEEELRELEAQLRASRAELIETLQGVTDQSQPVGLDQPIGRLSRMDAMQQQQMAVAQGRLARDRVALVDQALQRVTLGTYGDCVSCGEPIDVRRLRVKPESPVCLDCQRSRES